jgi:uncharacterized Zn finger protein
MSLFGKKCNGCGRKIKKNETMSELRINSASGIITMEVCNECGDFWDASTEFLRQKTHGKD